VLATLKHKQRQSGRGRPPLPLPNVTGENGRLWSGQRAWRHLYALRGLVQKHAGLLRLETLDNGKPIA